MPDRGVKSAESSSKIAIMDGGITQGLNRQDENSEALSFSMSCKSSERTALFEGALVSLGF